MGAGITWTAGLSSDRPGVEKGPGVVPWSTGIFRPLPTEPDDLPREQGWPCHSPGMRAG